jgi:predicted aldo/keto reductase-like oxidoreductase
MSGRRRFLREAALAAASFLSGSLVHGRGTTAAAPSLKPQGLPRRRLGRTGLMISEVCLGGSPLPAWPLFLEIIERGVNYVDSSVSYQNGNAERQVGRMLKTLGRGKAFAATKFHLRGSWSEASIISSVETSLKRLDVETIDVLLIHGPEDPDHLVDDRVLGAFEKLARQGKYRFKGFSCHANHAAMVRRAADSGVYDMIQLGYNVFDIDRPRAKVEVYDDYLEASGLRGLIRLATSRGMGVIAMKTLKVGGRRQRLEPGAAGSGSLQSAMLKWVLEDRNVTAAVTEMLNRTQMEEDLAACGSPLSETERQTLLVHVAQNTSAYCRSCGTCRRNCPAGIPTTEILRALAYEESYGRTSRAREILNGLGGRSALDSCRDCGTCERVCPFGLAVRRRLAEALDLLG